MKKIHTFKINIITLVVLITSSNLFCILGQVETSTPSGEAKSALSYWLDTLHNSNFTETSKLGGGALGQLSEIEGNIIKHSYKNPDEFKIATSKTRDKILESLGLSLLDKQMLTSSPVFLVPLTAAAEAKVSADREIEELVNNKINKIITDGKKHYSRTKNQSTNLSQADINFHLQRISRNPDSKKAAVIKKYENLIKKFKSTN